MSVVIHLDDEIDISRGDTLVNTNYQPQLSRQIEADLDDVATVARDHPAQRGAASRGAAGALSSEPGPDADPVADSGTDLEREMIDYYEARAPEYDDWYLRRGRYARGAIHDAHHYDRYWFAEKCPDPKMLNKIIKSCPFGASCRPFSGWPQARAATGST